MFCNKCGNEIKPNQKYCTRCGNRIVNHSENRKTSIIIAVLLLLIMISSTILIYIISGNSINYYFNNEGQLGQKQEEKEYEDNKNKEKKYTTDLITDNIYEGLHINNLDEAKELIVEDSVNQKKGDYPKEIEEIEDDIIKKYNITAVNLKEMDEDFAKELEEVLDKIYTEFPEAKEYLTNLSLVNLSMSYSSTIALFMPIFPFGLSDTESTLPWVIKTQIQLSARYFLNEDLLEYATEESSKAGYFPPNSTKYSPLAHELGHYLSFIALLNYYNMDEWVYIEESDYKLLYEISQDFAEGNFSKKMLDEAYQNYVNDYGKNVDFDEWRGEISKYALSKNESGNYIYDETIAEAFHDFYLNGDNAKEPSKYIIDVLKKYMKN